MPTFSYKPMQGGPAAMIEAPDRPSALRELIRRGTTPAALEQVETGAPASLGKAIEASWGRGSMTLPETAMFVRELATGLSAGLPLVPALKTIQRTSKPRARAMVASLVHDVEHGRSLAEAAAAWGKPFNDLIINMIRAGETSGRLPEVLRETANLLDKNVKLRRSVQAATLYPAILAVLIGVAVVIIVTVIVPRVLKSLPAGTRLPMPTRVVQGVAGFVGGYWWAILAGIGLAWWGWTTAYANAAFRMGFDRGLLKVPVLGRLLRDVAVSRFTRTLGMLTSAGIGILTSLKIVKGTLNNRAMEAVVDRVCEQVAAGKTISEPMEKSGYFPPMLVQIVNMGERSGRLDELLNNAADAFEERTDMSLKLFTTALPPLLIVVLAGTVGFVVLSIMLPLLQAQESIR